MQSAILKVLIIGGFLFSSCVEKPGCDIPEDRLVRILADVQLAESAAQNLVGPEKDSVLGEYYRQIFEIHRVKEEDFILCYKEMESAPERMNALYEKAIEELNRQEATLKKGSSPAGQ